MGLVPSLSWKLWGPGGATPAETRGRGGFSGAEGAGCVQPRRRAGWVGGRAPAPGRPRFPSRPDVGAGPDAAALEQRGAPNSQLRGRCRRAAPGGRQFSAPWAVGKSGRLRLRVAQGESALVFGSPSVPAPASGVSPALTGQRACYFPLGWAPGLYVQEGDFVLFHQEGPCPVPSDPARLSRWWLRECSVRI